MDIRQAARTVRYIFKDRVQETHYSGGGLARAVDKMGEEGLAHLLTSGEEAVELVDDGLTIRLSPVDGEIEIASFWETGEWASVRVPRAAVAVESLDQALNQLSVPLYQADNRWWFQPPAGAFVTRIVPAMPPESLGNPAFSRIFGTRYSHALGAMAGGIAGCRLVQAAGEAGMIGFFGAGGLSLERVQEAARQLGVFSVPAGANLLHSPQEPALEEAVVDCYLEAGIKVVDASAFMGLTPAVVRYRLAGVREEDGKIIVPNKLLAKISRPEVAEHFLKPAPLRILDELVERRAITSSVARLAQRFPVADAITAEADSGGHTDARPLSVLIPVMRRLAERLALPHWERALVGAAGGIGDPWSLAAALTLGADYTMTGSVNQACIEADTSTLVKEMLGGAAFADMARGPAPDMFELGASVQVLGKGSMYAQRAGRLYELYRNYGSIEAIPEADRLKVEKQIFQRSFKEVWEETERFWKSRDPGEIARAEADPHHKLALCCRWYLGLSSRWARAGEVGRKRDFQVWCGPSMGLFNDWVKGGELAPVEQRTVEKVNLGILNGAARVLRERAVG